ncbi:MAG TPA: DUF5715 family protein [Gemmatimonadaceae bacterium]
MSVRRLSPLLPPAAIIAALVIAPPAAGAQSLHGSHRSVERVWHYAVAHDYSFTHTAREVRRAVHEGRLVRLHPGRDYVLHEVSFPYVAPETRTFVRRLAAQYRRGCGEPLVVTSAVRPESVQPVNASDHSVHPTGIAIDLRRSKRGKCRRWLRKTLLVLERRGVVDATEEHHPAHFHVAVYPDAYREYLARR